MSAAHDRVVFELERAGCRTTGKGMWTCPAHEDRKPSLTISDSSDRALVYCQAGCTTKAVVAKLGLELTDLFDSTAKPREKRERAEILATYDYVADTGELLFQVVRFDPKDFRQRTPDGNGGWTWKLGDTRRVLYRLPAVLKAIGAGDAVYVVEGERDVHTLEQAGMVATSNAGGAGKWQAAYTDVFKGAEVVIVQDRDDPGRAHAKAIHDALQGVAKSVRIVEAKAGKDATDHIAAGFKVAEFVEVDLQTALESQGNPQELSQLGFTGRRLLELLDRPKPDPVRAGIPTPGHLELRVAPAFTGKSSLSYWTAMARAAGVAPWSGAPAYEAADVLILSPDESVEQAVRRMRSLALFHPAGPLDSYADRITVVGPDRDTDPDALDVLRFDDAGLALLSKWLDDAAAQGRPFAEVYLDAFADFVPADESENDNQFASRVGGFLERLAVRTGTAIVLLHHCGKPKDDKELSDIRFAGRGASSLAAKARIASIIEAPAGMPHLRRVRCITNLSATPKPALFEVCKPVEDAEELLYFRPHDPIGEHDVASLIGADEEISTSELAKRLAGMDGDDGKTPGGEAKTLAAALRNEWQRRGLIEVRDGPRRAKLLRLKTNSEDGIEGDKS